jgi:PAS domain S-box-containing protein
VLDILGNAAATSLAALPRGPVTENTFHHKLEELGRHFSSLEQFSHKAPEHVKELLPGVVAELRRSLEELDTMVAELPEKEGTPSNASARSSWKRSKKARPCRGRRFRAMAERGPVLVRIMGTETHCRWVNGAWLEYTGRSLEQLLGEGWLRAVHAEDRDRCARICHEAIDSSRLDRVEYRLQRRNGEYGWVLEIGTPRLNSSGSVCGYLGTAIEITEHKQAETHLALQYAVARVLSAAETVEEAISPILQMLCDSLGWDVGELWSVDTEDRVPRCVQLWASPSVDVSELQEGSRTRVFPPGEGAPWQSGNPIWIADITVDESLAREPEAQRLGLHGMYRLPVMVHGEIRAILRLFCRGVRQKDDAVVEFMTAVCIQVGQALERQLGLDRIRESETRKAAILEASLDAVITIDEHGRVVEFNAAAETIFGYRREDAVGSELVDLIVPPRLREQARARFARYRATGESGLLGKRFDAVALKSDGSEFPVEVAMATIAHGDQPMLTIFVCDATERRDAEREVQLYQEHLRSLMTDLLLAEEHERRQLASDLHDGLSQTIALTQIKLSALRLSVDGELTKSLEEIMGLVRETNRTARSISFELSPPVLHDLGLQPAVQWLVENICARYGIAIALEDDGQPKPADDMTRVILFRSIRELLINAAKHAGARRIHVRLEREEDRLRAAIEDDGVGMDPAVASVKGSGLFSIHERLSHVGGSMRIESAPGRGTRIRLCAPLTSSRQSKARVEA